MNDVFNCAVPAAESLRAALVDGIVVGFMSGVAATLVVISIVVKKLKVG